MELELHPIQAKILNTLLFKTEARFSDLNIEGLTSDHFVFHVNRILALGLVEKSATGKYSLTTVGKEYANRFDTEKAKIEKQPKAGVLLVCSRRNGRSFEYLIQQRLKQPYYGYFGFPTGKIRFGETILETASRELKEETGLSASLSLKAVKHKMDYSAENVLLEDKFFFLFHCTNTKGALLEKFEGGCNMWASKKKVLALDDLFDGVGESIELTKSKEIKFVETKYKVKGF